MKKFLLIYSILITAVFGFYFLYKEHKAVPESMEVGVVLAQPEFLFKKLNDSILMLACEHYGLKEPKIVTAQAILETGWFRSKVFREYNNPFGLFNSRTMQYFRFRHWSDAVIMYRDNIQKRLKRNEDYYNFLKRIGYAEDEDYINKVKALTDSLR